MTEDKDYFQENAEFRSILARYERMVRQNEASYFDVYQFEKIVDHYLDGNYFDQATKAVDFGIRQHPSATSLELKRAQIFAEKGDSSKALTLLKKLEKTDASNNELFLIKGMVYSQLGKTAEAEKTFDKALAITYENKEEILYDIAISYENNHQYKIALKYLKKALKIKPGKLNIIYEAAHCYERLHEYNNAAECYKKYLDKEPFAENVWYNLGTIYFKKEDFTLAVEAYDYAIALNDTYSSAYLNKAITLSHWGKYKEAVSVYLEFLQMEPQNVMAHCYLGECFERLEKFDDAIQWYQKAIDLDPDFSEAWFGLAICYQHKEDYVKARENVRRAIQLDKENPDYWFALGNIQIQLSTYPAAIDAFNKAIEIDPYDFEAWLSLAELKRSQSNVLDAIKVLKDSYNFNFDVPEINYQLAGYYFLSGEKDLCYNFFEKGLKLSTEEYSLTFKICPDGKEDKNMINLLSRYNPNLKT